MDTKVNYAIVGVFVLALCAIFIAGVLWLAVGSGKVKGYGLYMSVINESVAGLNVDAPVKYMGVDVGKVQQIELDPANPQEVRLLFAIEKGTPIRENTVAVLKTQGLTGIAYVELSGSTPGSPLLAAKAPDQYPRIRSKPSLNTRLENVLTSVFAKLDRTSANVDAIFDDENREEVKKILASSALVLSTIAAHRQDISSFITNAAKTADDTSRAAPQIDPMLNRISKAADAVGAMAREATLASTDARVVFADVGSGVHQFTGDTLPETERLLAELNTLLVSLRRLSEQTERNPSSLLRGRQPVPLGPGER
ncbi:MCE family protein [Desulfoprunum benzoelyticum]|uniref:Phospholipid/cholesterol/gamma-HCH transport system substrate-binding protein n=1 Tax=Desulfoprunum benzoelyticum TaxID=1506996 RepID=A0A840V015_9BACT|nr:phospholipid/cholesterol/gamma-HCH transport system substrate-binding protein [Desulfoprunum benzoelyticum]MBM9530527.1 MCE family protein [Desulfoprunum benzoelyticum]